MQVITEIKKGKGIDDVVRDITPGKLEEERLVEVVGQDLFEGLIDGCRRYFDSLDESKYTCIDSFFRHTDTQVLTSEQLNAFLQATVPLEGHVRYRGSMSGVINLLVQRSYQLGHDRFSFDMRNLNEICNLFAYLEYDGFNSIVAEVYGDPGQSLANHSDGLMLFVYGNVADYSLNDAKNLNADVCGNVGCGTGNNASDSSFIMRGKVGDRSFQGMTRSTVEIFGRAGAACGIKSQDSTFKTSDEVSLRNLLDSVSSQKYGERYDLKDAFSSGNKIVFIHPDGHEELVVHYG